MNDIAKKLFSIHTHAEIVYEQNPNQIVYRENDVIALLKDLGHEEPVFDGNLDEMSAEELEYDTKYWDLVKYRNKLVTLGTANDKGTPQWNASYKETQKLVAELELFITNYKNKNA